MSTERRVFRNKQDLIQNTILPSDTVLDVGFWGQGVTHTDPKWPHKLLQDTGAAVYGVDMVIDRSVFPDTSTYQEASAENFSFPEVRFDIIFAADLIEHLPSPGLFLARCKEHLKSGGHLVLTTPNAFNLFNIAGKCVNDEPVVNADHTLYLNHKVLRTLLEKCGFELEKIQYVYSLEYTHHESFKKKFLNVLYRIFSWFTPKFMETLAVTASPRE